eukprot:jgi/Mesen1/4292/ME000022S03579
MGIAGYGEPDGDGSDGGACGYGPLRPTLYGANIAAASVAIFGDGHQCGACYQIKCDTSSNPACSGQPVSVTVTDLCPGGDWCGNGKTHFDMSGTALGNLAASGQASVLHTCGVVNISYKRVPCVWKSNISLKINAGSSVWWLSILVLYQGGPGDIQSVEVQQTSGGGWTALRHDWGANYVLSGGAQGPYFLRITSQLTGVPVSCKNPIPANFSPGSTYDCGAQS